MIVIGLSGCERPAEQDKTGSIAVTAASSVSSSAVDWSYLSREYAEFLGRECDDKAPKDAESLCISLEHNDLLAFAKDAEQLPPSKDRAHLLAQVDKFNEQYRKYIDAMCPGGNVIICATAPAVLWAIKANIALTVKNNA